MRSGLGEYTGTIDPSWLKPAVSADEFFARDDRDFFIRREPEKRAEFEAGMAADRATIEAVMQPGDELRPFIHLLVPGGSSGCTGGAAESIASMIRSPHAMSACALAGTACRPTASAGTSA